MSNHLFQIICKILASITRALQPMKIFGSPICRCSRGRIAFILITAMVLWYLKAYIAKKAWSDNNNNNKTDPISMIRLYLIVQGHVAYGYYRSLQKREGLVFSRVTISLHV